MSPNKLLPEQPSVNRSQLRVGKRRRFAKKPKVISGKALRANSCTPAGIEAKFWVRERCCKIEKTGTPGFSEEDSNIKIDVVTNDNISLFDLLQQLFKRSLRKPLVG